MEHGATYSEVLTIIVPICTIALGVHAWFYAQIATERRAREDGLKEAREERVEITSELHDFKEQVARENVTHSTLEKFETRLIMTVDKLGDRIDRAFSHKA